MLNSFLKLVRKYEMIDHILWMFVYRRREGFEVKDDIKSYTESKKFNVKDRERPLMGGGLLKPIRFTNFNPTGNALLVLWTLDVVPKLLVCFNRLHQTVGP